jgi:hypothetical protein
MKFKIELKSWSIYFATLLIACFIHEIGHCIPAWMHGLLAVPTLAKEYMPHDIPVGIQQSISFGGIFGTILFAFMVLISGLIIKARFNWAILAGAMATPGFYTLRFIMMGRGHDATEFQEAQYFLGFSYDGHLLDWIFLFIVILGILIWMYKCRPNYKIAGRLMTGVILTIIFIIGLQTLNNLIFDPIMQKFHLS